MVASHCSIWVSSTHCAEVSATSNTKERSLHGNGGFDNKRKEIRLWIPVQTKILPEKDYISFSILDQLWKTVNSLYPLKKKKKKKYFLEEILLEWCIMLLAAFYRTDMWTTLWTCVSVCHSSTSHVAYLCAWRAEFHPCLSPCSEAHSLGSKAI